MFAENKNLKDSITPSPLQGEGRGEVDSRGWLSYKKINKLIIALYMVTDIIDNNESIRNKLRTLGLEIISDTSNMSRTPLDIVVGKIDQVMSFLDIASAVNIISEMNYSILKKEFLELDQSLRESTDKVKITNKQINLSEFFRDSPLEEYSDFSRREVDIHPVSQASHPSRREVNSKGHHSIGHRYSTRIGVQKGNTLLKALSKVEGMKALFDKIDAEIKPKGLRSSYAQSFDMLKKRRRNDIIDIIKSVNGNATIKDIKDKAQALQGENGSLTSCGEKTLQREIVSMVKDSVLNKIGEKRWSRYFIK